MKTLQTFAKNRSQLKIAQSDRWFLNRSSPNASLVSRYTQSNRRKAEYACGRMNEMEAENEMGRVKAMQ